jgi:hypothetical protein
LKRQEIIDRLTSLLSAVPNFANVALWDDIPTEYSQNAIYIKDTKEIYEKKNCKYLATLRIEILAIVIETPSNTALELGNIALVDLIGAVQQLSVRDTVVNLISSDKWIETSGKTVAQVELNIDVKYQF